MPSGPIFFFSKWLFTLPSGQAHAWAHGVGGSGPRTCPVMKLSVCCGIAHVLLRASVSLCSPPSTEEPRASGWCALAWLRCSQHAETCYLCRVHVCVLVEVLWLPKFGSHFSKWLNFRVKADGFWASSPLLPFSFCCLNQFVLITPCIHLLSLNQIPSPPFCYHNLSAKSYE